MVGQKFVCKLLLMTCLASAYSCGGGGVFSLHEGKAGGRAFQPAQSLLVGEHREKEGFGLYSYLLFSNPPTNKNRDLYLYALSACVDEIPNLNSLEKDGFPRQQLNVVYIPVKRSYPTSLQGDTFQAKRKRWSQWILQNYNYERARSILSRVPKALTTGPFILSMLQPAQNPVAYQTHYLFQDLSLVPHNKPEIAFQWVLDFIGWASNPQAWNYKNLVRRTSNFRDRMGMVFKANGIQPKKSDLDQSILISEPDMEHSHSL